MNRTLFLLALAVASCRGAPRRPAAESGMAASPPTEPCVVVRVADGDTFTCADGTRVRLLGIDSPERTQGDAFSSARRALLGLAPIGDTVGLERDVRATDQYGRRLAWVWRHGRLLNEVLVREGWSVLYTVPPNVRYAERIAEAQRRARAGSAGLWATGGFSCLPSDKRRGVC